ncbi:putative secretory lipase [Aspergillus clavatus NRRL 1]|uniref:Secretory lipase, putative n=1 Tax=Aspergillus clavatus (strain ATCC 1007 / CBS 513.65 / DSM 816 / NCTC 3887 / NRRL 1 / QM 1276 / 107) TaxID=344612 RepID=A1C9K4_ASPCL|nr:secretory lipase, putative [Aspergillus clavatus NRRL 1]EAW13528.1 secretory lipase, putative [Aspergillus clavatus NRRL 1]
MYSTTLTVGSFLALTLTALSASLPQIPQQQTGSPAAALPPSKDAWYTAPDNLTFSTPGTVLRVRRDPLNLYALIGTNISCASYNILYRTTNVQNRPTFAVTTLFVPASSQAASDRLLSYQIPYNSPWVDASPSYALATDLNGTFGDIAAALEQGWHVSVPDFEGPQATFAVGVNEGYAVLDSVRAATDFSSSLAGSPKRWQAALWGYSGGSIASVFAAELHAAYAPELTIAGVAVGGLPALFAKVLDAVNRSPAAGVIPLALWGYANAYPAVERYLLNRLTPEARASDVFTKARNMTGLEAGVAYLGADVYSYFVGGRDDIQSSPLLHFLFGTQGTMGRHGLPHMPVYVYHSINDKLALVNYVDALIEHYCAEGSLERGKGGVRIVYERNSVGGHGAEAINQDADALKFLSQALDGQLGAGWPNRQGEGCVIRNVSVGTDTSLDW